MANITFIVVGVEETPILPTLLDIDAINLNIICNNILDFELPPLVENAAPIWHRHELRNVLRQIGGDHFEISTSLKNLLKENDRLDLDEEYLGVTSHISQIEQNSKDLLVAYKLLLEQTNRESIKLLPLVKEQSQIIAIKNKRFAPLRYYHLEEQLLDKNIPGKIDKKKINDKELTISPTDTLLELKIADPSLKLMQDSDLICIVPTDLVSISALMYAKDLEKQIKNLQTPIVLLWPFQEEETENFSEVVQEITKKFGFGTSIDDFAEDMSFITDYVIIQKSEKEKIANLRKEGCHVLLSQFYDDDGKVNPNLIQTILGVGDLNSLSKNESNSAEKKTESAEVEKAEDDTIKENTTGENSSEQVPETDQEMAQTSGKKISQLAESPEEAGIERLKDDISVDENDNESSNLNNIIDDITKRESEIGDETRPIGEESISPLDETKEASDGIEDDIMEQLEDDSIEADESTDNEDEFDVREEEDWIDTVKRAIEQSFVKNNEQAINWLLKESSADSDLEMQIADFAVSAWIDARSSPDRKRGAEIISSLSQNHRETYIQIIQRHMVQAVKEMQEDKRRLLIPLFVILRDVDITLAELIIRAITKDLATLNEDEDLSVIETGKLSILQLVIQSRRLSRITIQELLNLLDSKPNIGPEIWNILVAFDAGSVSLELVTNFSISKSEEIIRRSNLLRFTGSYYSTITKVIQAWKDGDKAAISTATGTILPEETLRKFERLELARKLDKLKMVQLTTLAESLGKDTETVERLITELIVNDELKAEMKLIDDKMYLVSASEENQNSGK